MLMSRCNATTQPLSHWHLFRSKTKSPQTTDKHHSSNWSRMPLVYEHIPSRRYALNSFVFILDEDPVYPVLCRGSPLCISLPNECRQYPHVSRTEPNMRNMLDRSKAPTQPQSQNAISLGTPPLDSPSCLLCSSTWSKSVKGRFMI